MAGLKRPVSSSASGGPPRAAVDLEFRRRWPTLASYVLDVTWEDGSRRETATVTVFAEDGLLKASINDRAGKRTAFMAGETLDGLLDRLDTGLEEEKLDWRPWKGDKRK